jgi:eukaryotic-like serine/threonine-protein kinase
MGEVYRARDGTLGRDVALKLLPAEVVLDPDRVARFKREAQILAALNHPLIASIYGVEESNGAPVLVLELVEGPTLAERLREGRLPLEEALAIGHQIAQALEAAHEQGIVHRDLKPANIKLRPDGTVKVLDFGLAKGLGPPSDADHASRVTETRSAMTRLGAVVGTAGYMSPEQARGEAVDRGTDIWAFGVVLFEALSGSRAFAAGTTTETLAAVLRADPDWSRLPPDVPQSLRRVLRRCLTRERRRRLADIRDARLEIEEAQNGTEASSGAAPRPLWRERLLWLTAVVVALAGALIGLRHAPPAAGLREWHVEITTPQTSDPVSLALSPDGQKLAFVGTSEGRSLLWVRRLDTGDAQPLRGTDGAAFPFWSPDSRSIGFVAGEKLRRVGLDGDQPKVLGTAIVGAGGTWNRQGLVLLPLVPDSPLFWVPETGGTPVLLRTHSAGARWGGERFPQFLPDGRHFIYYAAESRSVLLGALDEPQRQHLLDADAAAVLAPPAEILFVREGVLYAQRFDPSRLRPEGATTSLATGVAVNPLGAAAVSASAEGSIAYRTGLANGARQLAWFDRSGHRLGAVGPVDTLNSLNPSLSPDGRRVVFTRSVNGNADLWTVDVERGIPNRFTEEATPDITAVWAPDGRSILYSGTAPGPGGFHLYVKPTAAEGARAPLVERSQPNCIAMDWSRDGRHVMYRARDVANDRDARWEIWVVPMQGARAPVAVVREAFDARQAKFSPDGRWIAFESNRSGAFEIYVRPFPGPGPNVRVSNAGGAQPRWRSDGTELFYVSPDGRLMSVAVRSASGGAGLALGTPQALFPIPVTSTVQGGVTQEYDVAPDGQRFLVNALVEQPTAPISLILDRRHVSR